MVKHENLFAKPLSFEELEARFKNAWSNVFSFFSDSCCIDTQPPLPPGA